MKEFELIIGLFLALAIGFVFGVVGTISFFMQEETLNVPRAETETEPPKAKSKKIKTKAKFAKTKKRKR